MDRVAVDVRALVMGGPKTGVPTYVEQLGTYLATAHPDSVALLSDRPYDGLPVQVVGSKIPGIPWQQGVLPWHLCKEKIRIFHGPAYVVPLLAPGIKVVTVHDMGFLVNPLWVDDPVHSYLKQRVPLAVRRADAIVVPSQQTKEDLLRFFPHLRSEKITVIELGSKYASDCCRVSVTESAGFPYILHVGTIEPRKNIVNLVKAFELAVANRKIPHRLVLVGVEGWKMRNWLDECRFRDRLIVPGFVSEAELEFWYRQADLYVQASHYEGFGLSTLDAFCIGLPVVATRTGWARQIVDPSLTWIEDSNSIESIYEGIMVGIENRASHRRTTRWTWKRCGELHWALYTGFAGS